MSDGKLNYERQKARQDMAAQIHEAAQIRRDRERDMVFIYAASVFLRGAWLIGPANVTTVTGGPDFVSEATQLLQRAKEMAAEINKEPDTSEDAA